MKEKRKKKFLIAVPPPTEPISYGLSLGSMPFSGNQPDGTPNPSPPGGSLRNSPCTYQESVFPGLDFSFGIHGQNMTVAVLSLSTVLPPEPEG